jgi:phosphatidylserine decarboxylase
MEHNTSYIEPTACPIAREGYPFIFASAFTTFVLALLGLTVLTLFFLVLTFFICFFFRDPNRLTPRDSAAIVSPADGKVITVGEVETTPFDDQKMLKISIFMSIFNVHVNRIPFDGKVEDIVYHPGKFFSANLDKASKENEHNAINIRTGNNRSFWVVQIAGLIARRIICKIGKGDKVSKGDRFGLICFGSRLDVYLPTDTKIEVAEGKIVKAGESIIGYMP